MLKKFISIKNIGRFKNSASRPNPELCRYTFIVGANGYGKTTLCAILRSLRLGDPTHILGRQTLGVAEAPSVEILPSTGQVLRFDGAAWSGSYPAIIIFDNVFVAENVHSGEVVEIDHRRNLYRVIIGEEGVRLAEEDASLAGQSREKTSEISAVARAIQPHIPTGMRLDAFLALPADPHIDVRIAEQVRIVEAVRQAKQINERSLFSEIAVPALPDGFASLLARTIDDIAQDAETRITEHLAAHGMEAGGGNWIAEGLEHAARETCPFCGQHVRGLPLIDAYQAVFSDRYRALRDEIKAMGTKVANQFGDAAIGHLNIRAEQNRGLADFWSQYCNFDPEPLAIPDDIPDAIHALGQAAMVLLGRKGRAPLEPLQPDDAFNSALAAYEAATAKAQQVDKAIQAVNALLTTKKQEAGTADVRAAEAELEGRRAIKVRHADHVARLCAYHARLTGEKDEIERRKGEVRGQLNTHTESVMLPYERRINKYLEAFNAGFQITETKHGYPGGTAASIYQLVINDTAIDLGDGGTPPDRPSFKNTLSSGDRTTLALAFFLAHLEQDHNLAAKTVVFDDPFNSQDAFRRRQTVQEIARVAQKCAQVIVLSHDATFLKQIWDKAPDAERVALTLVDQRALGSKIVPVQLELACKGRTATDIDDLHTYVTTGAGKYINLIRKMRVVLETYCWTTYPTCFQANRDWLGEIVRKIREEGDQHPAHALYDELDQINDYTAEHHHGEDMTSVTPDQIDPQELTGYVRRTLKIVNALQA